MPNTDKDASGRGEMNPREPLDPAHAIDECRDEIRKLKRDLYGNPQVKERGVFDRLGQLEERLADLKSQYQLERVEKGYFGRLEEDINQLQVDYKVMIWLIRAIAGGVGTIIITLIVAAIIGIVKIVGGV